MKKMIVPAALLALALALGLTACGGEPTQTPTPAPAVRATPPPPTKNDLGGFRWSCWADSNCRPHPYQFLSACFLLLQF